MLKTGEESKGIKEGKAREIEEPIFQEQPYRLMAHLLTTKEPNGQTEGEAEGKEAYTERRIQTCFR